MHGKLHETKQCLKIDYLITDCRLLIKKNTFCHIKWKNKFPIHYFYIIIVVLIFPCGEKS